MLTRLLVIASLLFAYPALAQTKSGPQWLADARAGCKVWDSFPQPGETVTWSGPCVNGYAEGRGIEQWYQNGKPTERYEGELKAGKANGYGVNHFSDGARYEGQWKDDRAHGQGTRTNANGEVYSGVWNNGCFKQGNRWAAVGASAAQCGFK